MSVRPRKLKTGKTVYWVTFSHNGKTVWERSGTDKVVAKDLEKRRRREVAAGTYNAQSKGYVTNRSWFDYYWTQRKNRTVDNDQQLIDNHVLTQDWFASMPLAETRPADIKRAIDAIKAAGRLGNKSVGLVYGVMRGAYHQAVFEQKIAVTPCVLPKGTIRWRTATANSRKPYTRAEAALLTRDDRIELGQRVWNALAFYTGMRMGEVCGRRWRDWAREAAPLTALHVHSQYDDRPLKTDDEEDTRPRTVPVHPDLEALLRLWWSEGWELTYRRRPTPDDIICPNRFGASRARATAYDAFQRSLALLGVTNRTVHATRNTFISVARSNGARKDVLERITHNAKGEVIEGYTTFEWRPLCEVVYCLNLDPIATDAELPVGPPGFEAGQGSAKAGEGDENGGNSDGPIGPGILAGSGVTGDKIDRGQARLRRLLKLAEVDPDAAAPGLAVCRALDAALRPDSADEVEAILLAEAKRSGGSL